MWEGGGGVEGEVGGRHVHQFVVLKKVHMG